jgi:hypothetical protein
VGPQFKAKFKLAVTTQTQIQTQRRFFDGFCRLRSCRLRRFSVFPLPEVCLLFRYGSLSPYDVGILLQASQLTLTRTLTLTFTLTRTLTLTLTPTLTLTLTLFLQPETAAIFGSVHRLCKHLFLHAHAHAHASFISTTTKAAA